MARLSKLWRFFPVKWELNKKLAQASHVSPMLAQLLINRGITEAAAVQDFLYGNEANLVDPFLLRDMDKAVERIVRAIQGKDKIVVYGDYDVDGITATALMVKVFKQLGADISYYIPERQSEGYGFNAGALEKLIDNGAQLLISVDCGISAAAETQAVKERLDIIITDHHQPPEILPEALAIVNPKQPGCPYPEKNLAGVGVAFKVCQAVWRKLLGKELQAFTELVALGTIADIVPLTGENRILVKLGLKHLSSGNASVGLQELMQISGVQAALLDAGKIGYTLAPRLNAAGRLGHAAKGVELLLTDERHEAAKFAAALNENNSQRQCLEKEILAKAEEQLQTVDTDAAKVLVLAGEDWHPGVIGIVASRIVDRYYRPVIVISIQAGVGRGSGRSIAGFDLYQALEQCGDLLIQYGGHRQAAGLSIYAEKIDELHNRLNGIAAEALSEADYCPVLNIDAVVGLEEVNAGLLEQLACLEPFGMGNPSPVFACRNVVLSDMRAIGQDGRHLRFSVRRKNFSGKGVAWNMGALTEELHCNTSIDVAFQPELNHWNGQSSIQLRTSDIRESSSEVSELDCLYTTEHQVVPCGALLPSAHFFTKIAGVTFENRQEIIQSLQVGQTLELNRESDNCHDPNAIAVRDGGGGKIGYLRAELAKGLAGELDAGQQYGCMVTAVTGGGDYPSGVNVLLFRQCTVPGVSGMAAQTVDQELIRAALLGERIYHESQQRVLQQLACRRNVLAIMGTGRGKSAIFQTHAALLALNEHKMTVVVYPLRALVNDQFMQQSHLLAKLGLRVFKGNGTLSTAERAALFTALQQGNVDILLTTPEFAEAHLEMLTAKQDKIGFFVVDECHHIGHSAKHRTVYRRLDNIIARIGNPLVLGVTATADSDTAALIESTLQINKTIIDKTVRDNLVLEDQRNVEDKFGCLVQVLRRREKTLVFVNSRRKAAELAGQLREELPELAQAIGFYHAGLNNEWRNKVEEWFRQGALQVVIATSAFGEGVDFPDIRHVIQYHLAFNLATFNQQCGRAGRDGGKATVHLLFGREDLKLNQLILQETAPDRAIIGKVYLVLKAEHSKYQQVLLTNKQIAGQVQAGYHVFISERGISVVLRILEELQLLWRETKDGKRAIYLCPPPPQKRELEQSAAYYEGQLECSEFSLFANYLLNAEAAEILTCMNGPLYPQNKEKQ